MLVLYIGTNGFDGNLVINILCDWGIWNVDIAHSENFTGESMIFDGSIGMVIFD